MQLIQGSRLQSKNSYGVLEPPESKKELEGFIRRAMRRDRILRLQLGGLGETVEDWWPEFTKWITELALKYRPWQYHWCSQMSGSIEFDWVEVDDWLFRYGKGV